MMERSPSFSGNQRRPGFFGDRVIGSGCAGRGMVDRSLLPELELSRLGASLAFVPRRVVVLQQPDGKSLCSSSRFALLRRKILTRTRPANVRQVPFQLIVNFTLHSPSPHGNGFRPKNHIPSLFWRV